MFWDFLRIVWFITLKDLRVWLRQPTTIAASVLPAFAFLLIQALGAEAVGRSPVALVLEDTSSQAQSMVMAIRNSNVFRLQEVDAARGEELLQNLNVVAVVTIPPDFSTKLQANQGATVDVTVNNLNLDFTNDIRRAVPDAITQYYLAQGNESPIQVTMNEHDLRPVDIELFQFAVLPILGLLLMISGLVTGGLATAREWETSTVKELLLSPSPGSAIITGKVLAGFVTSFALGMLVLGLGTGLGWLHPQGIYWLVTLGIVALIALFAASLGAAIGAAIRRIQPVIAVSLLIAFYLFFLSGGMSVLPFEPLWLQEIAAFVPLTYGNHALQMAVFYSSTDLLGRDVLVVGLSAMAALFLGILAIRRQLEK